MKGKRKRRRKGGTFCLIPVHNRESYNVADRVDLCTYLPIAVAEALVQICHFPPCSHFCLIAVLDYVQHTCLNTMWRTKANES